MRACRELGLKVYHTSLKEKAGFKLQLELQYFVLGKILLPYQLKAMRFQIISPLHVISDIVTPDSLTILVEMNEDFTANL